MSTPNLPHPTAGAEKTTNLSQAQLDLARGPLTPDQMSLMRVQERFSNDPFSDEHRVCQG
jgi:hypothetical protein